MPGCIDITDFLKIEGGKLWGKNECCEWEEIGTLEGQTEDLPTDPMNPTGDPGVTYSACGKAYAGAEILFSVAENIWDEYDNFPWQWIGHVESGTGLDLDNKWIIAGVNQSIIMQGVGFVKSLIINEPDKAWVRCQLASMFDDDPTGATEEQFKAIHNSISSHAGWNPFVLNFWDYVFFALGWKDFRDVTALGATDTSHDCTCSSGINDPTEDWPYDWAHFWDFTKSDGGWLANNELTVYADGQGWVDWADASTKYVKTAIRIPLVTPGSSTNFKRYWMLFSVGAQFDYSGDLVRMGTNLTDNLYGASAPGGDPVYTAGLHTVDHESWHMWAGAGETDFRMVAEGHVDTSEGNPTNPQSFRVLAIAVAGDGDDPFA